MIIGATGHVDHGKTTLIKALTGIDTDRLPEEKEREMSIVLGFAFIDLPKSGRVGIIDVPGHKQFMKNMLTGVRGIDIGLLVVAADESVMPQTREHFEIMRLSGVNQIIVVLNKIDVADEEMIETSTLEIKEMLGASPYKDSPILRVSAVTNDGIGELKTTLDEIVSQLSPKSVSGMPILPIDRCFGMKGVGVVVTGSLISGTINESDELMLYPQGLLARIRQIQVHNEYKSKATAGHRVAINLAGLKREDVEIGDMLSLKDILTPTKLIDVKIDLKQGVVLKNRLRIKAYIGTGEFIGRIRNMQEDGSCQIAYESPLVTWFRDRFILRSYSPERLLGGGIVLNPCARIRKRGEKISEIRAKEDIAEILLSELENENIRSEELRATLITPENEFETILNNLIKQGKVKRVAKYLTSTENIAKIETSIVNELSALHQQFPLKSSFPKDKVLKKINLDTEMFNLIVREFDNLETVGDNIRVARQKPILTPEQVEKIKRIEEAFKISIEPPIPNQKSQIPNPKSQPPTPKPQSPNSNPALVGRDIKMETELINLLIEEGKLIRIKGDFIVHQEKMEQIKQEIKKHIEKHKEMSIAELKEILDTTRKYTIPLAEYLDQIKFTKRVGDKRVLS
ncbi:MAG: selenocysteine-specific translation elongation factor [Candidatus Stahlbacteria bacterium]|nr:selenocysteine-specific translation elongation factor [Candidatus Stahlbacteria bacterium]